MRQQAVIENPILNSPFEEPQRHFRFDEHGITSQIVEQRRPSSYFIPIAQPKKKGKDRQLTIEGWTEDRIETNKTVNDIRQRVRLWREGGYPDVTRTTARCSSIGADPERSRRLFFCQIEALETLIYITETAKKYGDAWIENDLRQFNADANPELFRMALKMATGSGKTVVMAMLIAWQTLNKLANRARRPLLRRLSDRLAGYHHPRPPARAAPGRPAELLPRARNRPQRFDGRAGQGPNHHHQLPRLRAPRASSGGQADQSHSGPRRRVAVRRVGRRDGPPSLPRAGQQKEHHCHQRRSPPLLPPAASGRKRRRRKAGRRRTQRSRDAATKRPASGSAVWRPSNASWA